MILVLGGGFGLYGHLAALIGEGRRVATLARYRPTVEARIELAPLVDSVEWLDDEPDAIARAGTLVLARRPVDNALIARRWPGTRLVIEKPIAARPADADALVRPGLSVPYLYLHCDWFDRLAEAGGGSIDWRIAPSPAGAGWKRDPAEGGGPLAYYFIHCAAVAEALFPGADQAFRITDKTVILESAGGRLMQRLEITPMASSFAVKAGAATLFEGDSAFGPTPLAGAPDPRIGPLRRFYRETVFGPRTQAPAFHNAVHHLWQRMAA